MCDIWKTPGRRVKQSTICNSWMLLTRMWDIFDIAVFRVILGSFNALVSKWTVAPPKWSKGCQYQLKFDDLGICPYICGDNECIKTIKNAGS